MQGAAQQLLCRAELAEGQVGMSQAVVARLCREAADKERRLSTQAGQVQELAATRQNLTHTQQQLRALQLTLQVIVHTKLCTVTQLTYHRLGGMPGCCFCASCTVQGFGGGRGSLQVDFQCCVLLRSICLS